MGALKCERFRDSNPEPHLCAQEERPTDFRIPPGAGSPTFSSATLGIEIEDEPIYTLDASSVPTCVPILFPLPVKEPSLSSHSRCSYPVLPPFPLLLSQCGENPDPVPSTVQGPRLGLGLGCASPNHADMRTLLRRSLSSCCECLMSYDLKRQEQRNILWFLWRMTSDDNDDDDF